MPLVRASTTAARRPRRAFRFEALEDRLLLATLVYESFKTLEYEASGTFAGQLRADIETPNDYFDNYGGTLNFSGAVEFTSNTEGTSIDGFGSGSGSGIENCPPNFHVTDNYAYTFEAVSEVVVNGPQLAFDVSTWPGFEYSNQPCTEGYSAGFTPFDDTFEGTLDISSIPYKAVLDSSLVGSYYRNTGTIELDVYPTTFDEYNEYDVYVNLWALSGKGASIELYIAGPTFAAPSMTTAVAQLEVYFATGPDADDIIGEPVVTHPIYWNTAAVNLDYELPAIMPSGATHLVAIADRHGVLPDAVNGNKVASLDLPAAFQFYTFTAEIIEYSPSDNPLESADVAVGQTIVGSFSYDPKTGNYGAVMIPLPGVPLQPHDDFYTGFSYLGEPYEVGFVISTYTHLETWSQYPDLDTDLIFSGPGLIESEIPATLDGLQGEVQISSEDSWTQEIGFFLRAQITSLTPLATLAGISTAATLAEETTAAIDLVELYADVNVTIDPSSLTITLPPEHGTLSINSVTGVITYSPDPNFAGADSFEYTVRNDQNQPTTPAQVLLTVTEVPEPYQNPAGGFRVTPGDPYINSLDLALLVTELNATGMRILTPPAPGEDVSLYLDVNGDNVFSALDVALLLNYLNANGADSGPLGEDTTLLSEAALAEGESADRTELLVEATEPLLAELPVLTGTVTNATESGWPLSYAAWLWLQTRAATPANWSPLSPEQALASRAGRNAVDQLLSTADDWWREWAA